MSVKQEGKTESRDSHPLSRKKGKKFFQQGRNNSSNLTKPQNERTRFVKSVVSTDMKSNVITDSKQQFSENGKMDKHAKLKNIKKFKHKKALLKKQKDTDRITPQPTKQSGKNSVDNAESETSTGFNGKKMKNHTVAKQKSQSDKSRLASGSTNSMAAQKNKVTTVKNGGSHGEPGSKKKMKRLLWKQKQMAEKMARKGLVNKQEHKLVIDKSEKIELPKTADEATANWKKLQETIQTQKGVNRKRKIPEHRIRNPKLRKVDVSQDDEISTKDKEGEKEPEIWFDDVDEMLLDRKPVSLQQVPVTGDDETEAAKGDNPLVKPGAFKGVTKVVCMDCEMVGVGDGSEDMLARVSIVNQYGEPVYDKFVKPKEEVVDYRTFVSGVRPQDLEDAEEFEQVQKDVASILKGRTLVGHAIKNDLKVLYLSHPRKRIRDTSLYKPFRQLSGGRTPSLKKLSEKILGVKVQEGEHNSVQDAQATVRLYTMYRKQWESELKKQKRERWQKKTST